MFIDTIEAKLDSSSSVIRNLRAMIRSEGVENLDMKIENICESPVHTLKQTEIYHIDTKMLKRFFTFTFCCRSVQNQRA